MNHVFTHNSESSAMMVQEEAATFNEPPTQLNFDLSSPNVESFKAANRDLSDSNFIPVCIANEFTFVQVPEVLREEKVPSMERQAL